MEEIFLHYLWKLQYYDHTSLYTDCGQKLEIISKGFYNEHAGPDFSFAKVRIGSLTWVGHVEIHIKTSDWKAHQHHKDPAYDNVILHVVWENNRVKVNTSQGDIPPVLSLKERVPEHVLQNYAYLLQTQLEIPCASRFSQVPSIYKTFMQEKALYERLERKTLLIKNTLLTQKNDWEQTTYMLLMEAMGFKKNAALFKRLAHILPYKILLKQAQLIQVEALLFGQAGFLEESKVSDVYYKKLQKEYVYLASKFKLKKKSIKQSEWHFMRLRPMNFPTLRIAQIASILFKHRKLLNYFESFAGNSPQKLFENTVQATYWQTHYHFGKKYPKKLSFIGSASKESILINVIAPLLVARASHLGSEDVFGKAVELLQNIKGEKNGILNKWENLGLKANSAYASQSIIELNNEYCTQKRCLDCSIGNHLLKENHYSRSEY